jgi:predicted  nucleic acid-binding Zn-ribbon protein
LSADSPEFRALAELETVIRHLTEELASWRRRALKAEAQRSELGGDHDAVASRERILDLQSRNGELETRLVAARDRVTQLLERLRFLEEQIGREEQVR